MLQEGHEPAHAARPTPGHELKIEIAVRLEAMDQADVANAGFTTLLEQFDLRFEQSAQDFASRRGPRASVERIE